MKKTLVSALTTALVVGAASTTFAAANPFSDVPADHWAYDAVAQLAADGVIEGYGDSTFKGDRNITRYEMAQMVAKAMAKSTSGADKALVDKLAAEFADELNNLGVRVANLERNADMVKWNGKAEYTFQNFHHEAKTAAEDRDDRTNQVLFRLEPSAEVNSNWHVKARLDAKDNLSDDETTNVALKRVWAQGDYDNFQVRAGKFGNKIASDVIFDDTFSGVDVTFGNQLKATLAAGRVSNETLLDIPSALADCTAKQATVFGAKTDYYGIGLNYDGGSKLTARAGYQHFGIHQHHRVLDAKTIKDNVWSVGANYKFDKNVNIDAVYARGSVDKQYEENKTAFAYTLNYKGAQPENKGSWGAWVGYRYLGEGAALHPTYDVVERGYKGFEIGVKYTALKNVVTQLQYGNGAKIGAGDHHGYNSLFGRVEFLF
ncbi:S-layer protein [Selenomonas caprae]|uniref:S-layer protein n=1 Tax=Selenomonas caprae TaxID=2606905 RepID=A0A5D6WTV3_9FIRM|nr:S-layer homology domain-containing protein [Selenomonas caprae]TYZ29794.1 S-layer protein [Selenomonas caprae]